MKWHYRLARLLGYELFRPKQASHLTVERHLHTLLTHLDINCVIDVGANCGQYGEALRLAGYQGYIISFEPIKDCFLQLEKQSINDKHWFCYNHALGAVTETRKINITQSTKFSSFHAPLEESKEIFSKNVVVDDQEVLIKPLDLIWDSILSECEMNEDGLKVFLKMDTQGYDLEVFNGAKESINKILALQSEISIKPIYENMPDYLQSLNIYRNNGFEITGMYPVSRDPNSNIVIEFDCIMTRDTNM